MGKVWENVFLIWMVITVQCRNTDGSNRKCDGNEMVVYNLKFETNWKREVFPKQYPEWRPPAHWSKLAGRTHNSNYTLFKLGEIASENFKAFAETGKIDLPGNQNPLENSVYDEFYAPSLKSGVGKTEVHFFVDGNHSLLSLAARLVPSPDWFVGVDSLDLCSEGNWLDTVTIEASPIDAGTDSGFTFTAPNWQTEPQERIYKITSQYPRHPANSFYYPKLADLPAIATFQITKKRSYLISGTPVAMQNNSTDHPNIITKEDRNAEKKKTLRKTKLRPFCRVSEWSEWSVCECGKSRRTRKIIHSKKGNKLCPLLKEEKKCYDQKTDCSEFFTW